jgi:hypothetical protein
MFDECVIVSIVQTCRGTNYSGLMKDWRGEARKFDLCRRFDWFFSWNSISKLEGFQAFELSQKSSENFNDFHSIQIDPEVQKSFSTPSIKIKLSAHAHHLPHPHQKKFPSKLISTSFQPKVSLTKKFHKGNRFPHSIKHTRTSVPLKTPVAKVGKKTACEKPKDFRFFVRVLCLTCKLEEF